MCGMPQRSRTTRAGDERPSSARVPETWTTIGGGLAGLLHATETQRRGMSHRVAETQKAIFRFLLRDSVTLWPITSVPLWPTSLCVSVANTLTGMALKDALLADFDHEMGTTRRLLERVPDDRLSWKPHAKSMTIGALAMHLCSIPRWGVTIMNDPFFDLLASPPNEGDAVSRAGIL